MFLIYIICCYCLLHRLRHRHVYFTSSYPTLLLFTYSQLEYTTPQLQLKQFYQPDVMYSEDMDSKPLSTVFEI